jgi:hypothetical protein
LYLFIVCGWLVFSFETLLFATITRYQQKTLSLQQVMAILLAAVFVVVVAAGAVAAPVVVAVAVPVAVILFVVLFVVLVVVVLAAARLSVAEREPERCGS